MKRKLSDVLVSISDNLGRIAAVLESVAAVNNAKDKMSLEEDDSIGTCPSCESMDVIQEGNGARSIFRCNACQFIWINNANEFFNTRP